MAVNSGAPRLSPERRARINRIKRILVTINFSVMGIAILLSIIFGIRVIQLKGQVSDLKSQLKDKTKVEEQTKDTEEQTSEEEKETVDEPETEALEPEPEKVAYLTFDDGPSDNTMKILDILDKYNVKATFFVNGKDRNTYGYLYKEMVDRGHSLGMHTFTHNFTNVYASLESFIDETTRIHDYIYELTDGYDSYLFRFPGGSSTVYCKNITPLIEYLDSKGMVYYDWNVSNEDSVDSKEVPKDKLVSNVLNGCNGKDKVVILMHDGTLKNTTVQSLPEIIEGLIQRGYTIWPIKPNSFVSHHTIN